MNEANENKTLVEFWSKNYQMSDEEKAGIKVEEDEWKTLAPSDKLFAAAASLGKCKKLLDYGCGDAWASVIAAKNGCHDITAVDVAEGAADNALFTAKAFKVDEYLNISCVEPDYLTTIPDKTFDGFICSNVLDVIPPKTAEAIIDQMARIVTDDATIVIGMNFYISKELQEKKNIELVDGLYDYVDGVLRMVSRSDEEWTEIFSKHFVVEKLDHFAWTWAGETKETRRLFFLKKKLS